MFSAYRLSAKYVISPKNGPVPDRGANAYESASKPSAMPPHRRRIIV
ncbi:MAG: hypothetical protein IT426_19075 [Pirellulales bacterium]|nr:hypothetical protein [Pirellulales bacterium]